MSALNVIAFIVPGDPVGKGRPRASTIGGRPRLYTPAKTARYESTVALAAADAMMGHEPLNGPLALEIEAVSTPPLSWSKKRRHEAARGLGEHPAKRPDIDNVCKSVMDGANGILWNDDAQIVALQAVKRYGEVAEVRVRVATIAVALSL